MIANKKFFEKLQQEKVNCILICTSRVTFPLSLFLHVYIVTCLNGEIHRYEVFRKWGESNPPNGFLYKDLFPAWEGNRVFVGPLAFLGTQLFTCKLLHRFDATEYDIPKLIQKIEETYLEYPYRNVYHYLSPNSNTFAQWLLKQTGLDYRLPPLAFGAHTYSETR